jgi:polyisoprenoid-binding protein YceI
MMSIAIPGPGTWVFDTSHSSVEFVARHLMISKVRGGFSAFSGTVIVAEPVTDSAVDVTIKTASFSSGDENRDGHA